MKLNLIDVIRKCLALSLSVFITYLSHAQVDSLNLFLKNEMKNRGIPGLQYAIIKNGKILKQGQHGIANIQDSIAVKSSTIFAINSMTKAFTGVAIMQLVEQGKLDLSSPISSYLDSLPSAWQKVNLRQLLSHTSGIPNILNNSGSLVVANDYEASWKMIQTMPMEFKTSEAFNYNQTNYLLIGKIINKVSGKPFTQFIIENQLAKVGMPQTIKAGFADSNEVIANAVRGYTYFRKGSLTNVFEEFPSALYTAGGMASTASEMAKWLIALQKGELFSKKSSLEILWQPTLLNNGKTSGFGTLLNGWALGFPVAYRDEHPAITAIGGARSAFFFYPKDDFGIIVLTNLMGAFPESFIDEIAGFYYPDMKASNGFGPSKNFKQLKAELLKKGFHNTQVIFENLKRTNNAFEVPEGELNDWGYKLSGENKTKEAIEIFKLNTILYPKSGNTFDSLAEAYMNSGNSKLAIENYETAFKLNPQNANAETQIRKLKSIK